MIDPSRIFHWGYVVKNMPRSIKLWESQGAELIVSPAIDPIQNVQCGLLIWENAAAIELVAPMKTGPNPIGTRLSKGGGLDHICLFSDNLDADISRSLGQGNHLVVPRCYGAVFDRDLAFVLTRLGLTVEFMTREPVGKLEQDPLTGHFGF